MPDRELGDGNGRPTDRLLGELIAEVRTVKHNQNNTGQKLDAVSGKLDQLALVVATQGQLREHVERIENAQKEQEVDIDVLKADKLRREGAIGLVEWFARHWPFTVLGSIIVAVVLYANGKLHP